jgi:hypothetical protein
MTLCISNLKMLQQVTQHLVFMLRVLMLRVVVQTVIMLNVTAPQFESAILFFRKFKNGAILLKSFPAIFTSSRVETIDI